jgi:hypothetical protein
MYGLMYRGERKDCCAQTQLRGSIWNLWGGGCVSLSVRQREVCSFNAEHGDGCLALVRPDSDVVVLLIFVIARASVEVGFVGQVRFGYMSVPLRMGRRLLVLLLFGLGSIPALPPPTLPTKYPRISLNFLKRMESNGGNFVT